MVFSSHIFVYYFLPIALISYYLLPRRAKHFGLTLFSYIFYGWANPLFAPLMFASTLIDYTCGRIISGSERQRNRKLALTVSICSNLSLLGFFKYFNFGIANINAIVGWLGLPIWESVLHVTLPLGISFYTFQSMSYTIDVYRGDAKAIRNFIDFACYVSMFPQLVAGPIVRFSEIADQLRHRTHTLQKFARGIAFFSLGMAKKVLIANPCGKCADTVFEVGVVGTLDAWYGVIAYAFQIYFDFSGFKRSFKKNLKEFLTATTDKRFDEFGWLGREVRSLMLASIRSVTDKEKVSREWKRKNQSCFRRAGVRRKSCVRVWLFLLGFVLLEELGVIVLPDVCLSPSCERAGVDVHQYSDVLKGLTVKMQSARLPNFLWIPGYRHKG
ncbi:MBOAT family protein, partial [Candidatus Poribacteria bacterium]|nr:MBOAT family protein [Candidatus Poribacteria bacterium]